MRLFFRMMFAAVAASAVLAMSHSCQDGNLPDGPGTEIPGGQGGETDKPSETDCYMEVVSSYEDWTGDYLIAYKGSQGGSEVLYIFADWKDGVYGQPVSSAGDYTDFSGIATAGVLPADKVDEFRTVVTKVGEFYSLNVSNVGYIGYEGSGNTLSRRDNAPASSETAYLWKISFSDDNVAISNAEVPERQLQWNENHPRFSTYEGGQKLLTLYRRGKGTISPNPNPDPDPSPDPDPEPEPEPEPGPNPDIDHTGSGWFELPAIDDADNNGISDSNKNLYYASHICAGDEKYGHNGQPARNYTVCYSAEHHCPVWVAAPRHNMYNGSANRTDAYGKDPKIPAGIQYNSKSTGGGCNKGHMLGSAERTSSKATNKQVFYYTNIAPQLSSTFNTGGGAWNNLEDKVDTYVCADTLYEVVGCYFEKYTDKYGKTCDPATISFGGRSDVTRPSMFYYVLLRTKSGNTGKSVTQCSADELKCVAFVIRHNMEKGHRPEEKDMMSVSDLEKLTGFEYFTNVPNAPKDKFNSSDWGI